MSLDHLKSQLADYAKDTKLNLSKVLSEEGAPDLSAVQIYATALASAYATKSQLVVDAITAEAANVLSDTDVQAVKGAASIMGMNNIYYRFLHLVKDKEFGNLPANLRMQVIANPGVSKVDFELYSLAVSAINGCGMCMDAHVHEVMKGGISRLGVQSAIRIASVINAAAQSVFIEESAAQSVAKAA